MHIEPESIDEMDLLQLDQLRHDLRLSRLQVCRAADLAPSTYVRWFKHFRGDPGGASPRRSSLRAVREFLKEAVAERRKAELGNVHDRAA